jgi:hypothetical protein
VPSMVRTESDIRAGDFYEDCAYHPCLCIRVLDGEVSGVSLVDGSSPRSCDVSHCGIRRLTLEEALTWKFYGPPDVEIERERQWWDPLDSTARIYCPRPG